MDKLWQLCIPANSSWELVAGNRTGQLVAELQHEVGKDHLLWPMLKNLTVLAADKARDDILVASTLDSSALFVVHLTWSGRIEPSPWPNSTPVEPAELPEIFLSE